ncbi:hypothetical protein H5410_004520 [Solanum commersonii]|uniref:Uncharacterized protein n=1 Tax=Solanum commersonii TaxID=4109 RepID=A0A9J6B881_SOLCO|nr:hypothetical protein H5410_004520 [Solanum commersonii]
MCGVLSHTSLNCSIRRESSSNIETTKEEREIKNPPAQSQNKKCPIDDEEPWQIVSFDKNQSVGGHEARNGVLQQPLIVVDGPTTSSEPSFPPNPFLPSPDLVDATIQPSQPDSNTGTHTFSSLILSIPGPGGIYVPLEPAEPSTKLPSHDAYGERKEPSSSSSRLCGFNLLGKSLSQNPPPPPLVLSQVVNVHAREVEDTILLMRETRT